MDDIPLSAQITVLVILLIFSGFFSIAETSMMALNRYRLKHLVKEGNRGARHTAELLAKTDKLLGVILLGNTLINAAAATLTGLITLHYFGEDKIAQGIGTLVIAFAILVFSEITPKVIGAAYPEQIALPISYVLKPMLRLFTPAVWFSNLFVLALLKLMRLKINHGGEVQRLSPEELRSLVLEGSHYIPKKQQSILINLFDLKNITVEDVMTPRAQIAGIDLSTPIETIREQLATSYHTRMLVYEGEFNNIKGIVHLRKLLDLLESGAFTKEALTERVTPPYFIPASTAVLAQLQFFQENQERIALVVDEYGELQGLVTTEDIIEEIIGEFTTGAPLSRSSFGWENENGIETAVVEGTASLRELNRKLGLVLPLDGPKTLNGLIIEYLGDIPESGVAVKIGDCPIEILHTEDRVIRTVRIFRPGPVDTEPVPD